jgi:hypothetical protein
MAQCPLSPTEKSAKLAPFRLIVPLCEKLTAYLAKKSPFARLGPKETAGGMETGTRDGPLIEGDLVAEGDDFKLQSQTRTE